MPAAGKHTKLINVGKPKKDGTVTVSLQIVPDGSPKLKINVVAKVDISKDDSAVEKAKKITDAINAEIAKKVPAQQGAEASQGGFTFPSGRKVSLPLVAVSNKADFTLKKFKYDKGKTKEKSGVSNFAYVESAGLGDHAAVTFADTNTQVAVTLVGQATEGTVRLWIDDNPAIAVSTAGKTRDAVESELVERLIEHDIMAAQVRAPTAPEFAEGFPGSEIRLKGLEASEITVESEDDELAMAIALDDDPIEALILGEEALECLERAVAETGEDPSELAGKAVLRYLADKGTQNS